MRFGDSAPGRLTALGSRTQRTKWTDTVVTDGRGPVTPTVPSFSSDRTTTGGRGSSIGTVPRRDLQYRHTLVSGSPTTPDPKKARRSKVYYEGPQDHGSSPESRRPLFSPSSSGVETKTESTENSHGHSTDPDFFLELEHVVWSFEPDSPCSPDFTGPVGHQHVPGPWSVPSAPSEKGI